ncbi:MAG: PD-(D/E)XK nuclease family protein [Deltaproteobacteria bacterium]|nr:PD-(D/E)XK nuclease family protein [Deltaproteobacteria bacterium]
MRLEEVIREVLSDLPWLDHTRLVVGPLCSREAVKDQLLLQTPVVPSWAAGTLVEFASDILNKSKASVDKSLGLASQCDALERVGTQDFLKSAVPELCQHLKSRPVALKIAKFLTHLDRFYVTQEELDAVVDYFHSRDASLGAFTKVIVHLWRKGQLTPWGEGEILRRALNVLDEKNAKLPKKIWLWGFHEFTPLEEALLARVAEQGVSLKLLLPAAAFAQFAPRCQALGIELVALDETSPRVRVQVWQPHSSWDEFEFLRDRLKTLREQGVPWRQIALFVPNDDLYKRFARQRLQRWHVPLHDPTLAGAWKDNADWLWWRDFLKALASGLKLDEVRSWLGVGEGRHELYEAAFKQGLHGGAAQWARLLEENESPQLRVLVEGFALFGRTLMPTQFLNAAEQMVRRMGELLGDLPGADVFLEFARHISEERPFLEGFRGRLPRYVPLFEEFLDSRSRSQSLRAADGIHFVGHGVWLPEQVGHAFVLGANTLVRSKPPADLWDWEALEVRKLWDRLHLGLTHAERVARDESLLLYGLTAHENVVFSGTDHGISGELMPEAALFKKVKGQQTAAHAGGHEAVGWAITNVATTAHAEELLRPDLGPQAADGYSVRVSSFEDYLKCPFIYYARHVLKLEQEDELGLDPDGRARGNILHRVLERYLADELQGSRVDDLAAAKLKVRVLVDEEATRKNLTGMFRHEPLIAKAKATIGLRAEKWLEWEFENREMHPSLRPFAVEKPIELDLGGVLKLRGKADRIDSDGRHSVVIDYKSGAAPLIGKELQAGLGAQLLMYARATELEHALEPGAVFYLTVGNKVQGKNGVFLKKHQKALHTTHARNSGLYDGEFGTLFEKVSESWLQAAQRLRSGDFAPRPSRPKKDCPKCSYKPVCGFDPEVLQ